LGSFLDDLGIMLGSSWEHFGIMLGPFRNHFGIILGPFWNNVGTISESFWDHVGIISGSYGEHVGTDWDHCGIKTNENHKKTNDQKDLRTFNENTPNVSESSEEVNMVWAKMSRKRFSIGRMNDSWWRTMSK